MKLNCFHLCIVKLITKKKDIPPTALAELQEKKKEDIQPTVLAGLRKKKKDIPPTVLAEPRKKNMHLAIFSGTNVDNYVASSSGGIHAETDPPVKSLKTDPHW